MCIAHCYIISPVNSVFWVMFLIVLRLLLETTVETQFKLIQIIRKVRTCWLNETLKKQGVFRHGLRLRAKNGISLLSVCLQTSLSGSLSHG
jgi:hypothetical protein